VPTPAPAVSHMQNLTETFLPQLRPAQQRGVAEGVSGVRDAQSGCEAAILAAGAPLGREAHALRARLREFLCAGADRAAPCGTAVDVAACFAPLRGWVLAWWVGETLPLAIAATSWRDRQVVLSLSVLYRGSAIPVAWVVLPHRGKGLGRPHLERLLRLLAPAVPPTMTVLVMTDRGLWWPRVWRQIKAKGWHPLMRIRPDATCAPLGQRRQRARELVPGAGGYWVGDGVASKHKATRLAATVRVVWGDGQHEPWLLLTDLPPAGVDGRWYGLRGWIALGFRALQRFGWHWERTRRRDPRRASRGPGWSWPWPRCSPWRWARGWKTPPSRGSRPATCAAPAPPPPRRLVPAAPLSSAAAWTGCTAWWCAARAGGGPGGCGRKPCRLCPRASRSSVTARLSEVLMRNTSPSQPSSRESEGFC
jgi:hypothetical protein